VADIVSGSKVPMEISTRFALNARAPGAARHWLDQLAGVLPGGRLDDLRLVVSELVTNSVIHSDSPGPDRVDVKVQVLPDRVHVEVVDFGRGFVAGVKRGPPDEGGRGLAILQGIADRWGAERYRETMVWAELSLHRSPTTTVA
jgi:anti-sigma regulatory factor (Ser/Thr protein kinase)